MKTRLLLFIPALTLGMFLNGCNAHSQNLPDKQIVTAFKAKYPNAKKTEWESKQGFYVAEFHNDNIESQAWFDNKGKWTLTKNELRYNMLPAEIRNNLEKTDYNNWKKDDITKIERPNVLPIYIIEVEKAGQETNLYYTENGQLVKTMNDLKPNSPVDYSPLPAEIQNQIKQKYPQAILLDTDREKGKYEVDILDQGKNKEVIFNGTTWQTTFWEVNKTDVPTTVMDAFRNSTYGKYRIDEIHFFETPANTYYHFELEKDGQEVYLSVDTHGNILK